MASSLCERSSVKLPQLVGKKYTRKRHTNGNLQITFAFRRDIFPSNVYTTMVHPMCIPLPHIYLSISTVYFFLVYTMTMMVVGGDKMISIYLIITKFNLNRQKESQHHPSMIHQIPFLCSKYNPEIPLEYYFALCLFKIKSTPSLHKFTRHVYIKYVKCVILVWYGIYIHTVVILFYTSDYIHAFEK